jgi:hypothetical protein
MSKKVLKLLLSFLPSRLPRTSVEFGSWAKEVLEMAEFPDNNSTRHALASMLQMTPDKTVFLPKWHFVRTLQRAQISQMAFYVIQDLKKAEQDAKQKVEEPAS